MRTTAIQYTIDCLRELRGLTRGEPSGPAPVAVVRAVPTPGVNCELAFAFVDPVAAAFQAEQRDRDAERRERFNARMRETFASPLIAAGERQFASWLQDESDLTFDEYQTRCDEEFFERELADDEDCP